MSLYSRHNPHYRKLRYVTHGADRRQGSDATLKETDTSRPRVRSFSLLPLPFADPDGTLDGQSRYGNTGLMELSKAQDLVGRVRSVVEPNMIMLFGSTARGDSRPDSDIDICVVVPDGLQPGAIGRSIYRALSGFGKPVDVIVVTESNWVQYRNSVGFIYRAIDREKVILYAA